MMWLVIWKGARALFEDEEAERAVERAYIEFNLTRDNCPFYVVDNAHVRSMGIEVQVTSRELGRGEGIA